MSNQLDLAKLLRLPGLPDYLAQVDQHLLKSITASGPAIHQPAERIIKAGGKRLRPSLAIASAICLGSKVNDKLIQLATAIEMVHIACLIHDDIIDKASSRWNVATINDREGASQAIVVGDYLLARACELAAQVGQVEAQTIAKVITDLCVGQSLELADVGNPKRTIESMSQAISGKTAALISTACLLGGLSAVADQKLIEKLASYGWNFGMAFQLVDDLMDLLSDAELYSKPIGQDLAEGVYTLPVLLGLKGSRQREINSLLKSKPNHHRLVTFLLADGSIQSTVNSIDNYNRAAATAIDKLPNLEALKKLPTTYSQWALTNLVSPKYRQTISKMQKV